MSLDNLRHILGPAPSELSPSDLCCFISSELQRISSALMQLRAVEGPKRAAKPQKAKEKETMEKLKQLSEITGMSIKELVEMAKGGLG